MSGFRRHFCCCIPVRFAVFVTSILMVLGAGALSAAAFYLVWLMDHDPSKLTNNKNAIITVTKGSKIAVIVFGSVFALVSIISVFGFIGSVSRNRRMVKAYSIMVWFGFLIMASASGFYLYVIWSPNGLVKCQDVVGSVFKSCSSLSTGNKVGSTVVTALALLVQLYLSFVIRRYVDQLEDEQGYKTSIATSSYYPHQPLMSGDQYPYTNAAHGFGHSNGQSHGH